MMDIGVVPHEDLFKAEYIKYIRNGLMLQLQRIEPGENIRTESYAQSSDNFEMGLWNSEQKIM
jgi:hypothetical protein